MRRIQRVARGIGVLLALAVLLVAGQTLIRMNQQGENLPTAAAEVLRDDGLSPVVALAENLYYGVINPAKVGGAPTDGAVFGGADSSGGSNHTTLRVAKANVKAWGPAGVPSRLPARLASPVTPRPHEGEWVPTKIKVNGATAVYVARVRPDAVHTSVYAAVAWFDPKLLAFSQVPGTQLPEGNVPARGNGRVPAKLRRFYMAGFAAGYKMDQSQGGYVNKGFVTKALVKGKATLLTYPDGSIRIADWGRDTVPSNFVTARQNLDLMVDHGVSQVVNEDQAQWGQVWYGTGSGHNFIWRSGIGIRADGSVVYVQGAALSAGTLANLLVKAGAVEGMALDMNQAFANGDFYGPYRPSAMPINPENKLPANKFWKQSSRDFVAVFAKSPAQ